MASSAGSNSNFILPRQGPRHVLITGVAGFIGSHLACALLQRNCSVTGIDNFDPFYPRADKQLNLHRIANAATQADTEFKFIECDIRDASALIAAFSDAEPDAVFHMAALAGVRPSIREPARFASVNVDGVVNILDAARTVGCRNIIFASSSSVYGNNQKVPFSEDDPVDAPISPYAATKRAGELLCHSYAHLFQMRIAALRFFTVYGPAQRPDLAISTFMRLIAAGEEVPMFGDGTSSRDYTYIDDIISGVLAAHEIISGERVGIFQSETNANAESIPGSLSTGGFFRIWNLGNSNPITLAEMIDSIARVVGKPARIKKMPMQPGDVERTWADLSRSRAELQYQPCTPFEVGVQRQWEASCL